MKLNFLKAAMVSTVLIVSSFANAGIIYGIDRADNNLVSVDLDTYSSSVIGNLGTDEEFGGLAYNLNTSIMYMAGGRGNNSIYTVDYNTGAATLLGGHGISDVFGLAFDSVNNVLFGTTTNNQLYSFNLIDGSATLIGSTGFNIGGLSFDSNLDKLIGLSTGGSNIFDINRSTGVATTVKSGLPSTNDIGFTYDYDADKFYSLGLNGTLHSYSSNDYSSSLLASNLPRLDGLTYVGNSVDVPEPSTLAIFALGMIGLASRRFKKQS
jgi:hypothetical protein|tara:strand:+ start:938 stop:1735 length:798 start_codon:yes stop_codon:yes gene_type:complete